MGIAEMKKQGATLNVRPEGQIDTATTPLLDKELQPHLEGVRDIVMDFSEVEYITSSGLRLLMWLNQKMEENGGEVKRPEPLLQHGQRWDLSAEYAIRQAPAIPWGHLPGGRAFRFRFRSCSWRGSIPVPGIHAGMRR